MSLADMPAIAPKIQRPGHRGRFWLLSEILPFAVGILLWQALSSLNVWPRVLFPSPLEVAQAFVEDTASGVLLVNLGVSLHSLLLGFALGRKGGIFVGTPE